MTERTTRWMRGGALMGALAALGVAGALTAGGLASAEAPEAGVVADKDDKAASSPRLQAGADAIVAARFGRQHTPSPAIIPDQSIPFRFSHKVHLEDLECTDCHDMVEDSVRSSDVNLPLEESCFDCHDTQAAHDEPPGDPPADCTICHPGFEVKWPEGHEDWTDTKAATVHPPAWELPPPNLKFNHKVHLDKGFECSKCHGDLTEIEFATRDNVLPTMGKCLECHDGKTAPDECRTCHLTLPDGRIDVNAGATPLKPAGWYFGDAHDDHWLRNHKTVAQTDQAYCENCHTPKECIDCHNGVNKPLKVHPNNWIVAHPVAARKNSPTCSSCHRAQTFCVNCHQNLHVAREGQTMPLDHGINFHPEGWVDYGSGVRSEAHHGFHAQRNIRQCTGCHTEETCLGCHNPKAYGAANWPFGAINPHPPGFEGSARCKAMFKRNHRACFKCHERNEAALESCR